MAEKGESTTINITNNGETSKERKGKAPLLAPPAAFGTTFISKNTNSHNNNAKGGYKRGLAIFDFVLRICAIAASLAATITMGTTEETLPFFTQFLQFQASYDDLPTFSFFVIANAITTGYLFLSLPFSIVCIVRPKATGARLFLIISDTVILALTVAAASSSAAIVYLAHNGNTSANWPAICQQFGDFCKSTSGAVVGAFITVTIFVFLIVLSAFAL